MGRVLTHPATPTGGRTAGPPVRVLIVDDSASMRRLIRLGLDSDDRIEIVAEAASAQEARMAIKQHAPDVITLDIEMPGMDGLEFLERIMRARPMPVIMISSMTSAGSQAALRALALGAVDCVEKPRFGMARQTFGDLREKIVIAASARVRGEQQARARPAAPEPLAGDWNGKRILIGASTGGVEAIETVLASFPADCPPTLITQHMPAPFLAGFAARLGGLVAPQVQLARTGDRLRRGHVFIAPGGATHLAIDPGGETLRLLAGPKRTGHRPSVDVLFESAIGDAGRTIAVLLTGMGRDGAEQMKALRQAGAQCIAQDRASSVVYGMPRVACELGAAEAALPLEKIARHVLNLAAEAAA